MTVEEAIAIRLHSQQLLCPQFARAEEVVSWMGMMQAQDYNHFRWAIGMRMKEPGMKAVNDRLSSGKVVRLHLLRCTVQTVTAEDYPWVLELCKERNLSTIKSWPSYKRAEFSEQYHEEATDAIKGILAGGKSMTKKRIGEEMSRLGLPGDNDHVHQILLRGEIEGLFVSGEVQGRDATWTLADNIFRNIEGYKTGVNFQNKELYPQFSVDEALSALARKYFRSHSPASFEDFCWWTGLPITQNRKAVQLIAPELEEVKIGEQVMFVYKSAEPLQTTNEKSVLLLPPYDEYLIGYKSRWIALDKRYEHKAHNNFGIFHPVILYNGKVVGNWKASLASQAKTIATDVFAMKREVGVRRLEKAEDALRKFCE